KRRFEIARGQGQRPIAKRSEASDDIASDVEPYDDDRTRKAQHDGGNKNPGAPLYNRKRRDVGAGNVAFGIFHQLVDSSAQASREADVLGQEACCIGGQIKLALAQFWNAFGSADERTQSNRPLAAAAWDQVPRSSVPIRVTFAGAGKPRPLS